MQIEIVENTNLPEFSNRLLQLFDSSTMHPHVKK